MNITKNELIGVLKRIQKDCNNRDEEWVEKNLPIIEEFDIAYQSAVAAFVSEKGQVKDLDILREFLREAYSGNDLSVDFIEE